MFIHFSVAFCTAHCALDLAPQKCPLLLLLLSYARSSFHSYSLLSFSISVFFFRHFVWRSLKLDLNLHQLHARVCLYVSCRSRCLAFCDTNFYSQSYCCFPLEVSYVMSQVSFLSSFVIVCVCILLEKGYTLKNCVCSALAHYSKLHFQPVCVSILF